MNIEELLDEGPRIQWKEKRRKQKKNSRKLNTHKKKRNASERQDGIGNTESSEAVQETPHPLLLLPPHAARAPRQFSVHHTLWQSRVLHARYKSIDQDLPPAHNHLDALTSRPYERALVGNRVVDAIVLSPADAANREAVVGSAKRVVEAHARAPRNAAIQHCLKYLGS